MEQAGRARRNTALLGIGIGCEGLRAVAGVPDTWRHPLGVLGGAATLAGLGVVLWRHRASQTQT